MRSRRTIWYAVVFFYKIDNMQAAPSASNGATSHRECVDRLVGNPYQFAPHIIEQRRQFFDMLVRFNDRRGVALTGPPTVSKQPIDLHRLYLAVQENGGFHQVGVSVASIVNKTK
jgi:hypothetical protein